MRVGRRVLLLVLVLTVPLFGVPVPGRRTVDTRPSASGPIDIDPWFVQDRWTHTTHAVTRFPDGTYTDTTAVVDTTVTEVRTETVRGVVLSVYNATTDGTIATTGSIPLPRVGPRPFSLSGTTSGWAWTDRSDLGLVRTNQTVTASGSVDLPFPIPDATITADGATTVTFLPSEEDFDFPLEVGDAWSFNVTVNTTGYAHLRVQSVLGTFDNRTDLATVTQSRMSLWFNGTQDVTVPAGPFPAAAHIHAASPGAAPSDRWYHPAAKNLVKTESHAVAAPNNYVHVWVNLTAYSLVAPPWPGTIALTPERVNPGGGVTANGTANPDEEVVVSVPATRAMYRTRADGTGSWSVRIRAPRTDDFTPSNADVGSHGVLVEPAAVPAGWDVATVQLAVPDLFAGPSDLVLLDPAPVTGIPVDVTGTVHVGTAVGVLSPFNASFTADGVEFARFEVPELPAGQARAFTASWRPTSGWHTVGLTADADGVVEETDEENNTATRRVFVQGPDLAPVDVVIEAEGTVAYPDPAAVGYVSAPVQGRLGGLIRVTFEAANVGQAEAPPFLVAVVETQGLRGPPAAPRTFAVAVPAAVPPGAHAGPWSASWPVPNRPGVYHLNVTVDADSQVDEGDESNNTFALVVNVSGPDYRIVTLAAPAKVPAGSVHAIAAVVRNDGMLSGDREVSLAGYEGTSPTPFATVVVPPLAVSEERTFSLPWTAPGSGRLADLRFVIDADGVLGEMDEANNEATVILDVREPPVTQITIEGPNVTARGALYVRGTTRFVLAATDRSDTGLTTHYRIGDEGPSVYIAPVSVVGEGVHTLAYWSEDNLGGVEAPSRLDLIVDDTPPSIRAFRVSEGNRTVVVLDVGDAGVGVGGVAYRVDGGDWRGYNGSFTVMGYGDHTVAFRAVDLLGNEAPEANVTWTVRRLQPPATNVKPFLAVTFAAILLLVALLPKARRTRGSVRSVLLASLFGTAEVATGVLSTVYAGLAVPPIGSGLAVDLALFSGGLALTILSSPRRSERAEPEAPTDK